MDFLHLSNTEALYLTTLTSQIHPQVDPDSVLQKLLNIE